MMREAALGDLSLSPAPGAEGQPHPENGVELAEGPTALRRSMPQKLCQHWEGGDVARLEFRQCSP